MRLAFAAGGLVPETPPAPAPGQSVRIVNVIDPAMAADYLTSSAGEKTILNILQRNAGAVRQVLSCLHGPCEDDVAMTAYVGFVDNTSMLAHYQMLEKIRDVCAAEGWTVLRYDTGIANRELILMAPGLSGTEQIFCGVYCYQDSNADYYNLAVATMKGYVEANSFLTQPGISPVCGVPAHNQRTDYWLSVNGQRLNGAMKVGTPVYESFGMGKFFPYASPGQYPQPLFAAGMLGGATATRYSETTHSMPWKGNRNTLRMHSNDGTWKTPLTTPWGNTTMANATRPAQTSYALYPVMLYDAGNLYGALDGIYHITGFDNVVENTLVIDAKDHVVIQDVSRTAFGDYIALELA